MLTSNARLGIRSAYAPIRGAMATYAAENAIRIVRELRKDTDAEGLLAALGTYPSVANEYYPGVRVIAAVLPFLLFLAGAIVLLLKTPARGEWWVGLIAFGLIPPGTLLMLIRKRMTEYKPNSTLPQNGRANEASGSSAPPPA